MARTTSPLADRLPAELRVEIYKLALRQEKKLTPYRKELDPFQYYRRIDLPLLRVSRAVQAEALGAFYKCNIIRLDFSDRCHNFAMASSVLGPLGYPGIAGLVRQVELVVASVALVVLGDRRVRDTLVDAITLWKACPKITSVSIVSLRYGDEGLASLVSALDLGSELRHIASGHLQLEGTEWAMVHFKSHKYY